jgi:hypothetical protein
VITGFIGQAVELVTLPEYSPRRAAPAWDLLRDNRDFQTMVSFNPAHTQPTPQQIQDNFQVRTNLASLGGISIGLKTVSPPPPLPPCSDICFTVFEYILPVNFYFPIIFPCHFPFYVLSS